MLRILAVSLLFAFSLFSQPMLTATVAQPQPSGPATVIVNFQDTYPSSNLAGVSFSIGAPDGATFGTVNPLAATVAAQKTVLTAGSTFELIGSVANGAQTALSSGQFFSVSITPPTTAGSGIMTISLLAPQGVSTAGSPVSVTAGPTVYMCSLYDLTGDCLVSQDDVNLMQQASLGQIPCAGALVNIGDEQCTVVDVQEVILAAIGQ
jgi:hypothetical protein